jgi:hypothetical protein
MHARPNVNAHTRRVFLSILLAIEGFDMPIALLIDVIDNPSFLLLALRVVHCRLRTDRS